MRGFLSKGKLILVLCQTKGNKTLGAFDYKRKGKKEREKKERKKKEREKRKENRKKKIKCVYKII